jgi:hypothetical protein
VVVVVLVVVALIETMETLVTIPYSLQSQPSRVVVEEETLTHLIAPLAETVLLALVVVVQD